MIDYILVAKAAARSGATVRTVGARQETGIQLEGIYVPIITAFDADHAIDYLAWGEVIDWQIENGTQGMIVGGST